MRRTDILYRLSVVALIALLGSIAVEIPSANAEEPFDTVVSYTEALRTGDTGRIKSLIAGRLYEKNELLLNENDEYPDFLRNYYHGASFRVSDELTDLGERGQAVTIEIRFSSGHYNEIVAIVEQMSDGSWKVIDEIDAAP